MISIVVTIAVIAYAIWFFYYEPQHIPLFLGITIVALSFVAVMAALRNHRQRLIRKILAYHAKEKSLGALYRCRTVALALIIMNSIIFSIVLRYQLVPLQYMPFYTLAFVVITLASGILLIAALLKTAGKWGLLFVAILIIIGVLLAWIRILTRT